MPERWIARFQLDTGIISALPFLIEVDVE